MTTGTFITQKRNELGMSQEELAGKLNVSRPTISTWENGHFLPGTSYIKKLAVIFNCTTDELLNPTVPPTEGEGE